MQQPAWKSVYSSGPTTHRHKQASRPSSSPGGEGKRPLSKQHAGLSSLPCTAATPARPCSSATTEEQNKSAEIVAEYNCSDARQQPLICSRATTPGKAKEAAPSNSSAATTDATQLTRQHAATQQQQQQQAPADNSSRPATPLGTASASGNIHAASTRRLSSPPSQVVPRPAQQQALSPYLVALPVTARRPRSPGGPRPASPLSGLSRAARTGGPHTPSTILAATVTDGNSYPQQDQRRSRGGMHSASGRKRPHQQQLRRSLAEFRIQVSYGPQPGAVIQGEAAAGTPAVAAPTQTAASQQGNRVAQPVNMTYSSPAAADSSSTAGVEALQHAQVAGNSTAAAHVVADAAQCQYAAGQDSDDGGAGFNANAAAAGGAAAGVCGFDGGSSCSEGAEQGLGMMLSEYILQMHTTPVACNSVSGLGDESEYEEDYEPAPHSSSHRTHPYTGQGSILASWGMQGAPSSAGLLQPLPGDDDDSTAPSTPASESDHSMAALATEWNAAGDAAPAAAATHIAVAAPAAGSPFISAAAEAWQHTSCPDAYDNRPSSSWQLPVDCLQDSAGSTCSSECMQTDHEATTTTTTTTAATAMELGFPPSDCDCEVYRDIMGSSSSSSSLDLDAHFAGNSKNLTSSSMAAAGGQLQRVLAAAAPTAQGMSVRSEAVAGSSLRPRSSAGRRVQEGSSSALPIKEVQAGRRSSGFSMASANSLDLRPATAMAAVSGSSSTSSLSAADAHAAMLVGGGNGRPLSSCQQQRSFTDLDSSAEGFVKEVSLGHLSASLFTPSGADASARVPLQRLWGSFEVASTQSSFISRDAGALQHQQHRQQDVYGEGCAAAAAEQQQQLCSRGQKILSPTRTSPGSGAGFLQRLTESTHRADADSQPSTHAVVMGGWCGSDDADKRALHCVEPGSSTQLASCFGRRSRTSQETQEQSMKLPPERTARSVCSAAADRSYMAAQASSPGAGLAPIVAWGAAACTAAGPAGRPTSRRTPSAADVSCSSQLEPTCPEPLQQHEAWAVHVSSSSSMEPDSSSCGVSTGAGFGTGAGLKLQQAISASLRACQHADVVRQSRNAAMASVGQLGQQPVRPPSRQRPPSESLHLFNSFGALS